MRPSGFFVSFEGERWQAACVSGGRVECAEIAPREGAQEWAGALADQLRRWGWTGSGVCLGLPSDWVLGARIECGDLPRKGRHEAMRYRLEEALPLDAERLTADFLPATGSSVFAVAVDTLRVRGVLAKLSEAGVKAGAISATALLALQDVCARLGAEGDYAIIAGSERADVFRLVDGRPVAWSVVEPRLEDLQRALRADLLVNPIEGRKATARVLGTLDPAVSAALARDGRIEFLPADEGPLQAAAARGAATMLAGDADGWADFRRDGLAPSNAWGESPALLRSVAALAVALPAVLAGVFLWRAGQYEQATREFAAKQVAEYVRVYPNTPVPESVASRLKSEVTRLTGLHGAGARMPEMHSALEELRRAVAALPNGLVKVTELRVGPSDVSLDGETRSHADAEQVARALRQVGFEVEPPLSEADARGVVQFSLTAKFGATDAGAAPVSTNAPVAETREARP